MAFVNHAFEMLPKIKDQEEATFALNSLYDEFMGFLAQYTPEVFRLEPFATMRAWANENIYSVLREKQDMRYFIEKRVGESVPGLSYEQYKRMTTYERDWLKEILSTPSAAQLAEQRELEKLKQSFDGKK